MTPPGIDPGTFRRVAQRLNHYTTPRQFIKLYETITEYFLKIVKHKGMRNIKFITTEQSADCLTPKLPVQGTFCARNEITLSVSRAGSVIPNVRGGAVG